MKVKVEQDKSTESESNCGNGQMKVKVEKDESVEKVKVIVAMCD